MFRGSEKHTPKYQYFARLPEGDRWFRTKRAAKRAKTAGQTARAPKRNSKRDKYQAYLRSDGWRALRNLVLERDHAQCLCCKATTFLHVHHRHYQTLYHETGGELATLCRSCHRALHNRGWKAARMGDLALKPVRTVHFDVDSPSRVFNSQGVWTKKHSAKNASNAVRQESS